MRKKSGSAFLCFTETPTPMRINIRATRGKPEAGARAQTPERLARRYSRFMTVMFWVLMPFGQTASHSW